MNSLDTAWREIIIEFLSDNLDYEEEQEVWRKAKYKPYTNKDYVEDNKQREINALLTALKSALVERLPKVEFRKNPSDYEQGYDDGKDQAIAEVKELLK